MPSMIESCLLLFLIESNRLERTAKSQQDVRRRQQALDACQGGAGRGADDAGRGDPVLDPLQRLRRPLQRLPGRRRAAGGEIE